MVNALRSVLEAEIHHLAKIFYELFDSRGWWIIKRLQTFWDDDIGSHNGLLNFANMHRRVHDVRELRRITNDDSAVPVHH